MALELLMTDGTKSVPLNALPESAWRYITGGSSDTGELNPVTAVQVVPILYRALEMRGNAIASLPWALYRGDGDEDVKETAEYQSLVGGMRRRLKLTSASLDVYGACYWIKETNRFGRNLTPRWLMPTTMTAVTEANAPERVRAEFDAKDGLYGFMRRDGAGRDLFLSWEEVVYFWELTLTSELGHGQGCVRAALAAAGALNHIDKFVEAYFKRGVIKATVFQVEGNADKGDMQRLENVLRSMLGGIKKAFSLLVLRSNFKPIVIGDSAKDTAAPELTEQKREDIAMAMGVPFSLLYSQAANYATSQTDYLTFYTQTVVPQAEMIEEALNEQLFGALGLRFAFQPEKLEVFQAAELTKAGAVMTVVGTPVLTVDEGRAMLDYEPLPSEREIPRVEGMLVADVEGGIVTKNERRERLGLDPTPEDVSETERRQLLAQLAIVKAATDARLTPAQGVMLALGESLDMVLSMQEQARETLQEQMQPGVNEEDDKLHAEDDAPRPSAGDEAGTEGGDGEADGEAENEEGDTLKLLLAELKAARLEWALFEVEAGLKVAPDDDGDLDTRGEMEDRGTRSIGGALGKQLGAALDGDLDDADEAAERLEEETEGLRAAVTMTVTGAALAGVRAVRRQVGRVGVDWSLVNEEARDWARQYSYELVGELNETSRQLLRDEIARWMESGEELERLVERLTPQFGEGRARVIATTEVTRGYAQGNLMGWRRRGGVTRFRWHTAVDQRVCPICGPRDGEEYGLGAETPPAHPRCRCWMTAVL